MTGFWVFGYGSLMWKPGFPFLERRLARLDGYRRAFRLRSIHYRGTPELPGLVLGLDWDPNARCVGMAFRVCPTQGEEVRDYLADRELITRSYFEVLYPVALLDDDGTAAERVDAICYVLDRTHPQYAAGLSLDEQAQVIARACGPMGTNTEYLHNTVDRLTEHGIHDPDMAELDRRVRALCSGPASEEG